MNLGEFYDQLRFMIKRGSSLDGQLPGYVRRAARFLEQNYTLQYMRRRFEVTSEIGTNRIALPPNVPIKTIENLRFLGSDGTEYPVNKGSMNDSALRAFYPAYPSSFSSRYDPGVGWVGMPTVYYLDGVSALVFNQNFLESLTGEGIMVRYSEWPTADDQTHWLLENAEGLLLRQSMKEYFLATRDDRGQAGNDAQWQQDLKAMLNADYEMRYAGADLSSGL
jgi:hypothetical protein